MRRSGSIALTALLALSAPAVADAACPETARFKGILHAAQFTGGGGPLGKRSLEVGDRVQGREVSVGETYYVPRGHSARFKLHGYRSRAAGGAVFVIQCDIWTQKHLYFRLLEGSVGVSGKRISGSAKGSPPGSGIATPEATVLPLPGRPRYTAKRVVTDSARTTRTTVRAAGGASNLFVQLSTLAKRGKKIPCQAGAAVTIFGNGRYRSG